MSEAPKTLYVACRFARWSNTTARGLGRLAEKMDNGSIGMLPVFATREEAVKVAQGAEVLMVQEHVGEPNE